MLNNSSLTKTKDKINTVTAQFHFSDLGNAERLIHQNKKDIRYCPEINLFLIWDGKRWRKDVDGEITRRAIKSVRSMYDTTTSNDPAEQMKWAMSSESRARLESMVNIAKALPGVPISISELDKHKYLLNCLNGTVNLETGELLPHDRKHKLTHLITLDYRLYQDNFCPQWIKFLHEITNNDQELINYLWRLAGLCLSGDISEHLLHILYGAKGRNGKGIYIGTLQRILGSELSCVLPFSSFEPKNSAGIPNDIARMSGKRLVIAQESRENVRLDEALIKGLTGGDILTGRFLRAEFFDFEPTHKILMSTNNKPVIREASDAIWVRLRIIPFEISFLGREDKKLTKKLNEELPDILSWAVAGFQEWLKHGLKMPKCMETAFKDYRSKEDIVETFIGEACDLNSYNTVAFKDLYNAFVAWAIASGEKPLPKKLFNSRIRQRNFAEYKASGLPRLRGIGLADNTERPY